jgi:hypothetical protein
MDFIDLFLWLSKVPLGQRGSGKWYWKYVNNGAQLSEVG